jgi:short-subunit dehydrogenase
MARREALVSLRALGHHGCMKNFRGKRVLITGAASGIGSLLAGGFAARGSHVFVTDRNLVGAESVAAELTARGQEASAHELDVTDVAQVSALARELGSLDVLVNNAGVVFGGAFAEVSLQSHLTTLRVNIEGVVVLTHTLLPLLLKAREPHIVNIASASGFIGLPYGSTYAASKWAVIGFSESLRLELIELHAEHVAVTTVCPGYIGTGMFSGVKSPIVMPMLTPESITDKILHGVENNAAFVKEPFIVKALDLLKAVAPVKVFDRATQLLGVTASMQPWKGHDRQS